jgi:WD40 repeat protein
MQDLKKAWGNLKHLEPLTPFPTTTKGDLKKAHLHYNFIGGMAVDSQYLYTSSEDGSLRVWDKESLKALETIETEQQPINYIAISPDGIYLIASDDDYLVKVYQRQENGHFRLLHKLKSHQGYVSKVVFARDKIVSISKDGTVKVWNYKTGKLLHTLTGHEDWVYAVATSPDGKLAVTSSLNSSLKVWDIEKGVLVDTLLGGSSLHYIMGMTIGGNNNTDKGNREAPNDLLWIGNILISVAQDIVAWNTHNWEILWHKDSANHNKIKRIAYIAKHNMIITAGERIEGWHLETGELFFSAVAHEGEELYSCIAWNDEILYTGDKNGVVKMWDIEGLLGQGYQIKHTNYVYCLSYNTQSDKLLTTAFDGTAILYNKEAKPLKQMGLPEAHGAKIIGKLPKRPEIEVLSVSGQVHFIDTNTGAIEHTFVLDNKLIQFDEAYFLSNTKILGVSLSYLPRLIDLETKQISIFQLHYAFTHIHTVGDKLLFNTYPTEPLDTRYKSDSKSFESELKPKMKKIKGGEGRPVNETMSPFVVIDPKKWGTITEYWLPEHIQLQAKYDKVYPMHTHVLTDSIVAIEYNSSDLVIWNLESKNVITVLPTEEEYHHFVFVLEGKMYAIGKSGEMRIYDNASFKVIEKIKLFAETKVNTCAYVDREAKLLFYVANKVFLTVFDLQTYKQRFSLELPIEPFRILTHGDYLFVGTNQGQTFTFKMSNF